MDPVEFIMQLGETVQRSPKSVGIALGATPLALGLLTLLRKHRAEKQTTHGSARWATHREIKKAGMYGTQGILYGRMEKHILCDNGEGHVLLVGPTRSKKGVGVIIPTLLSWDGSVIVLDPKDGENANKTRMWRSQFSEAYEFAPHRSTSAHINVLNSIRLGKPEETGDALTIAQSLVAAEKQARESEVSTHFRELASFLLTAAILHISYTARVKSLAAVWHFLTQQYQDLPTCLKAMRETTHHKSGAHYTIASLVTAIQNISGDRELSSVWTTAIRPLALFMDPLIAKNTNDSSVDLNNLQYAARGMSLYLEAPSPGELSRLHPIYRVILDVALTRLMRHPVRTWTHRLLLCCDELPWYGYVKAIDKNIAVIAGYGIKAMLVAQDLTSLEEVYGERSAIWGNTDIKIFHTPTNDLTAKRISDNMLGKGTVQYATTNTQEGLVGRSSQAMHHVARPLMTTDEVLEMDNDFEIIRKGGMKPILCQKLDYRTDSFFQGRYV